MAPNFQVLDDAWQYHSKGWFFLRIIWNVERYLVIHVRHIITKLINDSYGLFARKIHILISVKLWMFISSRTRKSSLTLCRINFPSCKEASKLFLRLSYQQHIRHHKLCYIRCVYAHPAVRQLPKYTRSGVRCSQGNNPFIINRKYLWPTHWNLLPI
jgi:hypothetical protein